MGTKNAATVAQNAYTNALNTLLASDTLDHVANFADDFLGGANTYESLTHHFEEFLRMCQKANITINPAKLRIGFEEETFYGYSIKNGRISPSERNLDPIKRMVAPKNRGELRPIMGIFNQFSSFIKDYGRINSQKLLNSLMSPKVEWNFTQKHIDALEDLKQICTPDPQSQDSIYMRQTTSISSFLRLMLVMMAGGQSSSKILMEREES